MTLPGGWMLGLVAASAIVLIGLERIRPYNSGQRLLRTGFFMDLLEYNFLQSYVLGIVIAALIARLDSAAGGVSRLRLVGGWPLGLQVAFFVVTHDLYIYLFHRLQHRSPLLWRIHQAHHSVAEVDWLSGARSHALEILVNQTVEFAPIVLLGAAPEVAVWKGAISAIWGMFIHSNLDVRMGPLQYVFNGPEMHRWHHSVRPEAENRNFSTKLAIWDWIFGTAFFPDPRRRKAAQYGIDDPDFPSGYLAQQWYAFRRRLERPVAPPLEDIRRYSGKSGLGESGWSQSFGSSSSSRASTASMDRSSGFGGVSCRTPRSSTWQPSRRNASETRSAPCVRSTSTSRPTSPT